MKRYIQLALLLFAFQLSNAQTFHGQSKAPTTSLALWYREPATKWMSGALPIGNGLIGAMIFGGVETEHIQYNDKTLWSGSTTKRGSYQNFGDLFLEFPKVNNVENYRRELDLENAVSRVSYTSNGIKYSREYFCSYVDNVIVMRITSSVKGMISFTANIQDAHQDIKPSPTIKASGNSINQIGKLDILDFAAQLSIKNDGGTITADDDGKLSVKGANSAILILALGTNYDPLAPGYLGQSSQTLYSKIAERNKKAASQNYQKLYETHIKDYHQLFNRVSLDLSQVKSQMPTNELLSSYMKGDSDTYLEVLYYQYGRYLMISSARGIALPSNLQGLWNDSNNPAWQADLHSDINVQMNYWPAEITNLSELHLTLTDYLFNESQVQPSWRKAAKDDGTQGWSQWVQNNIFGFGDWAKTRPANAWYSMHMWQHYTFTLDKQYLAAKAYPVMKAASDYWLGRLVENDGKLIAPKEWSPEIGPWNVEGGVAYAQQLIWDLLSNTINASLVLNVDEDYRKKLSSTLDRLDNGLKIGSWGQLMEWNNKAIEDKNSGPKIHIDIFLT